MPIAFPFYFIILSAKLHCQSQVSLEKSATSEAVTVTAQSQFCNEVACVRLNRTGIKLNDPKCASLLVTCCIIHTPVCQTVLVIPMIYLREEGGRTSALRRCAVY